MGCSIPGSPVHHQALELAQIHVHRVSDAIQPSHPLSSSFPPAFNLASLRVFSNESVLCIRWPKYWSFSISISLARNIQDGFRLGLTGLRKLSAEDLMLLNCGVGEDSLRVPWTARRSNQSILKELNPEYSLEGLMLKLKLQYFGHLMRRPDSLEKTLMLEKIEGWRKRG